MRRHTLNRLPVPNFRVSRQGFTSVDYHIAIERNCYSVPYTLIGKSVDAFLTTSSVQILHRGERIATHPRLTGQNHHSTLDPHRAPAHSAIANRTPDWLRGEAAKVGVATAEYVERLLTGRDHVEQGIRSCLGILRMAGKYPAARMDAACQRALIAGARSSGYVEELLKSGRPIPEAVSDDGAGHHGNIRGSGYYHN
jgi:hypothetical protein